MPLAKLKYHIPRLRHALGKRLALGGRQYVLSGYHADRLAFDLSDEVHLIAVIKRVLKRRNGAFLDVGANCGQTLFKVLSIDPDREYIGFEPQIDCCFYINQFKRRNKVSTISIVPVALSDEGGIVSLFQDRPADVTASLLPNQFDSQNDPRNYASWVVAKKGDDLVREMGIGAISAIKIDVEGFELEVIRGFQKTIEDSRPDILFEVLTNRKWGVLFKDENVRLEKQNRANKIFEILSLIGYDIYRIDDKGVELRIDSFDLDSELGENFSNDGRDYIAKPRV